MSYHQEGFGCPKEASDVILGNRWPTWPLGIWFPQRSAQRGFGPTASPRNGLMVAMRAEMGQIDPKRTQRCFGHAMTQVATKMGKMRLGCPKYQPALPAGCEGKCGMAAIRLKPGMSFEGENFYAFTKETLPSYAAPRFVRIQVSGPRLLGGASRGWFLASRLPTMELGLLVAPRAGDAVGATTCWGGFRMMVSRSPTSDDIFWVAPFPMTPPGSPS